MREGLEVLLSYVTANTILINIVNVVLIYFIFLISICTFIKFFKEEEVFLENLKKILCLSICIFGLVFTSIENLYIGFIVACCLTLFLFHVVLEMKIKILLFLNTYILISYFLVNYELGILISLNDELIGGLLINVLCFVIFFLVYKIVDRCNINKDLVSDLNKNDIIKLIVGYSIILLMCLVSLCSITLNEDFLMLICNLILSFVIVYVMSLNIIKSSKLNKSLRLIDTLETSNESLTVQNDKIRTFKHDFNNIIQAMNGYVMNEDLVSLKKYVKKIVKDVNDVKEIKVDNNTFLNNTAIVSLLNRKNSRAIKENVQISFEIMYELKLLEKYEYELVRILGIFLDNAIEAEKDEEDKKVEVLFVKDKESKYIIIENNCSKDVDLNKIYTKDFSTKEGNSGLGLWEVKTIVEKNPNFFLETKIENNTFKHILKVV